LLRRPSDSRANVVTRASLKCQRHKLLLLAALLCLPAPAQIPPDAQALLRAYPDALDRWEAPDTLVWKDGTRMHWGAPRPALTFEARLADATLRDQMSIPYCRDWPMSPPTVDNDPGRLRYEPFFRKLYGDSARDVEKNLVRVPWPAAGAGRFVRFSPLHGAADALQAVGAEIAALPENVRAYVASPNGTFNWRVIAKTNRLSMHSFGIAIDFTMPNNAETYWQWKTQGEGEAPAEPRLSYPAGILDNAALQQIVTIFEKHGFIWGGKWYHYDLMHFEYRPELTNTVSEF